MRTDLDADDLPQKVSLDLDVPQGAILAAFVITLQPDGQAAITEHSILAHISPGDRAQFPRHLRAMADLIEMQELPETEEPGAAPLG